MTRRLLTATAVFFASSLIVPNIGHAQTFKVEKFDIKGDGGTDYVAVEAASGRAFVSRGTHMMVIEGATGKVLGDIPNTPGVHGAGIVASKTGTLLAQDRENNGREPDDYPQGLSGSH
jgi:hypothetical protein